MTVDDFENLTEDEQEELLEKHFGQYPKERFNQQSPEWQAELKEWQAVHGGIARITLH